jgi:tetratricopeptide (TPR) repeat protein
LLETLLASDPPEEAAVHALAAADLHEQRGDAAALARVLEQGRRRAPDHAQLIARIERSYREAADHAALAQLLRECAEREQAPERRSALWLEAAVLYRDQLSQPAQAVALLGRAAELAPSDVEIASELAALHLALDMPDEAIEQLGRALENCTGDARRSALLRMRAGALQAQGELDAALADLEQAFELEPAAVAPELESFLEERRRAARSAADVARERSATMRLSDVLIAQEKLTPARKALSEWIARERDDREALQRLVDLCAIEGDTLGIAETAARLCAVSEGEMQGNACRTLTDAALQIGRFDLARSGLEAVLREQPEHAEFRAALRDIYARTGANHELARLLLDDAGRADQPGEATALLKQAGECLLAADDAPQAISVLREALAVAPDDAELTFLLVDAFTAAGEIAAADGVLDGLLPSLGGRRPELSQHARRKARLAQAAGDRTTQLAWLVEAGKYDKSGALTIEIANLAESLEDWDTAEKALRNLLLAKEDVAIGRCEVYVRQARIWMARGDSKRALMLARKAQKEEPESAQVIMLLQQLGAA